ncbi:hypothetical protein QFC22_002029 [Naganishia vaughanmartiniae]|uniref:Uncharacterized protein n=1 Tax=Naganishia vaughanmartiniae TaxID=1424756 RepID=A0ACC2XG71_9TREE|nr:hypothetical protein QFC22_002029 [Naganishia vaughanmartiniae]
MRITGLQDANNANTLRCSIEERDALEPHAPNTEAIADNNGVEGAVTNVPSATMTPDIPVLDPTGAGDEVDAMSILTDPDMLSDIVSDSDDSRPNHLAGIAARKKAMAEKQTQREAEQKAKDEQHAQQTADAKAKREGHNEKRRLEDDLLVLDEDMAELDREFRRQHMAPRTVPIGTDRFGNRVWWFDGCGSADLMSKEGTIAYGTGRLYVQGAPKYELAARCNIFNIPDTEVADRRTAEEGTALLSEGEWAMIDETEQVGELPCTFL